MYDLLHALCLCMKVIFAVSSAPLVGSPQFIRHILDIGQLNLLDAFTVCASDHTFLSVLFC